MADVTQSTTLKAFQWSRPDAENPRLSAPIDSADTTILVTNPPLFPFFISALAIACCLFSVVSIP